MKVHFNLGRYSFFAIYLADLNVFLDTFYTRTTTNL